MRIFIIRVKLAFGKLNNYRKKTTMCEIDRITSAITAVERNIRIAVLAELVGCVANQDTTAPDPTNPRFGWDTDQALSYVDKVVAYWHYDPAALVEIAELALSQLKAKETPEAVALVSLTVFRGKRLLPPSPENETEVQYIIRQLDTFIAALSEGPRKLRCQVLFWYHLGVFYSAYGHFAKAAEAQAKSAELADELGDRAGAAASRFLEAVERLKEALAKGTDQWAERFAEMVARLAEVQNAVRGTHMEIAWRGFNGPIYLAQACVWLGVSQHPDWGGWVTSILAAAEKIGKAGELGAALVRALDLFARDDRKVEYELASVVGDPNQLPEYKATAYLVLVRLFLKGGNLEEAKRYASMIPQYGAQHVRAIVDRLLQ